MTKKQINDEILEITKQLQSDKLAVSMLNKLIRLQYKRINQLLVMRDGEIKGLEYDFKKENKRFI